MTKYIGILTSGSDSPGLNAAIRGVGKAALNQYDMQLIGFRDGFRGLMENRTMSLEAANLSGILTRGGTILGTSRDKPHRMPIGGKMQDMTDVIVDNYREIILMSWSAWAAAVRKRTRCASRKKASTSSPCPRP